MAKRANKNVENLVPISVIRNIFSLLPLPSLLMSCGLSALVILTETMFTCELAVLEIPSAALSLTPKNIFKNKPLAWVTAIPPIAPNKFHPVNDKID